MGNKRLGSGELFPTDTPIPAEMMIGREEALWQRFYELADADPSEGDPMAEFMRMQLWPGVEPPPLPPGPEPPWMAKRPAGIKALIAAFRDGSIDPERLRAFDCPVPARS